MRRGLATACNSTTRVIRGQWSDQYNLASSSADRRVIHVRVAFFRSGLRSRIWTGWWGRKGKNRVFITRRPIHCKPPNQSSNLSLTPEPGTEIFDAGTGGQNALICGDCRTRDPQLKNLADMSLTSRSYCEYILPDTTTECAWRSQSGPNCMLPTQHRTGLCARQDFGGLSVSLVLKSHF